MANVARRPAVMAEVPVLAAEGLSIRAVSTRLGISRQTVRRILAAAAMLTATGGGTHAMAASPCHPSTVPPAWAMAAGDHVLMSTSAAGLTGLVSGWLSAHHAPALVADDYQLVSSETRMLVVPVRAGFVCDGEAMVQISIDAAADLVAAMTTHARARA